MVRVKICGITRREDALAAMEAGADAIGFVFYDKSPRYISPEAAREIVFSLPPFISAIGLFVNERAETIVKIAGELALSAVQLHGDESPDFCGHLPLKVIKAIRVSGEKDLKGIASYAVSAVLLDSFQKGLYGGTGVALDWKKLRGVEGKIPLILSGGLTSENVQEAIRTVSPYAVDVSSGVEEKPGIKSAEKMRKFIQNAKSARDK